MNRGKTWPGSDETLLTDCEMLDLDGGNVDVGVQRKEIRRSANTGESAIRKHASREIWRRKEVTVTSLIATE